MRTSSSTRTRWQISAIRKIVNIFMAVHAERVRVCRAGSATLILHILLRLSVGASDVIVSGSKSGSKSRLSSSAEARLEELRRASQGRLARLSGGRSLVYMLVCSQTPFRIHL